MTAAERRVLKLPIDNHRREVVAAGVALLEGDYELFAEDRS